MMTITLTTSFAIQSWDEKTWDGQPAAEVKTAKATRASVTYAYEGDIIGTSQIEYVMLYVDEVNGSWVAVEKITGTVNGKSGSFALQHTGTFDKLRVHGTCSVVPDSGTGELAGLSGNGSLSIEGHQERYPLALTVTFGSAG